MKKIPARIRTRINKTLCRLPNYHQGIPLGTIFGILKDNHVVPLQEDNMEWDGVICGAEGQTTFPLGDLNEIRHNVLVCERDEPTYTPVDNVLCLSWYKMPSGRYEVVTYVS